MTPLPHDYECDYTRAVQAQIAAIEARITGEPVPHMEDPLVFPEPDWASGAECDLEADRYYAKRMGW